MILFSSIRAQEFENKQDNLKIEAGSSNKLFWECKNLVYSSPRQFKLNALMSPVLKHLDTRVNQVCYKQILVQTAKNVLGSALTLLQNDDICKHLKTSQQKVRNPTKKRYIYIDNG